MLDRITPLILTRDEEANIGRTLGQLSWAREVVVIDSLSTDATVAIASQFPNVRIVSRAFDSHAEQWRFGAEQVRSPWVLTLDADYYLPSEITGELASLDPQPGTAGYEASFVYAVNGRPLRAALYPPRVVLLRRGAFEFWQDGHTQRVRVDGAVARLRARIIHDDRKDAKRFMSRQRVYMQKEAVKLRSTPWRRLSITGKARRLVVVAPLLVPFYVLLIQRAAFDGRAGWRYARERFLAELILSRELIRSSGHQPSSAGAEK